ncbi:hypothetical protein H696_00462 [Fonticula alba]|uniref:Solute carrier family 25, member 33/36 n=1 Tax=Fonticula alba TaxID=691883 RepID=A0A058ZG13_FONAL|nr:hypothetical protein H696_00462 [Fonticula alba]KCV72891.1 hypothetical protein H696_00462 [Fonticula alba]|eukprot:XP_009492592.1 hypothetical protein H696_00462 [Fonticula alba]
MSSDATAASKSRRDTLRSLVAGAGSGLIAALATCPLDVVKTRLQLQSSSSVAPEKRYRGPFDALVRISRQEGVRGLYRGLSPTLAGYIPNWAIYFTIYETVKSLCDRHALFSSTESGGSTTPWANRQIAVNVLSAVVAGGMTATATNPIWVIKTRMMTSALLPPTSQSRAAAGRAIACDPNTAYASISSTAQSIFRSEGFSGFYRGLPASFLGLTHVAVHFPLYEYLRTQLLAHQAKKGGPGDDAAAYLSIWQVAMASCTSKVIASSLTYPHEVLRTRIQISSHLGGLYDGGLFRAAATVINEEGFSALYRGLGANLMRVVPSATITLVAYEVLSGRLWSNV